METSSRLCEPDCAYRCVFDVAGGGGGGGVFATGWTYTQTFITHFIFTSSSKSFLLDTCLLTGRGKTVSLGRCSGFGQSLQLLQLVCQPRQYLTDKNPSGTQNMIVRETNVHIQRMMIFPLLSLKPSIFQALLYAARSVAVTLTQRRGGKT